MKRILLILFSLFVVATGYSQAVSSTVWYAQQVSGWDTTGIFSDGNTKGWYIADTDNFTTIGDTVISQWDDVSGNANHLLQSTSANRPHYTSEYVIFDGIDDYMDVSFTLEQPTTVYVVVMVDNWGNSEAIFDGATSAGGLLYAHTTSLKYQAYAGSGLDDITIPGIEDDVVFSVIFNGASSRSSVNGGVSTSSGNAGAGDMDGLTVGSWGNQTNYSTISVREIIIRSTADSESNETNILGYLNDTYTIY